MRQLGCAKFIGLEKELLNMELMKSGNEQNSIHTFSKNNTYQPSKEVLVLEDDRALETVIRRVLRSIDPGLGVRWASSLDEAYCELGEIKYEVGNQPSLILSDIYLPNMDSGTSLWEHCQRRFPDVPFAFMSSLAADRYINLFKSSSNLPPFISKPFSILECKEVLGGLLYSKGKFS